MWILKRIRDQRLDACCEEVELYLATVSVVTVNTDGDESVLEKVEVIIVCHLVVPLSEVNETQIESLKPPAERKIL